MLKEIEQLESQKAVLVSKCQWDREVIAHQLDHIEEKSKWVDSMVGLGMKIAPSAKYIGPLLTLLMGVKTISVLRSSKGRGSVMKTGLFAISTLKKVYGLYKGFKAARSFAKSKSSS